jgi:hypothetical protein
VILPLENKKDLTELPEPVAKEMEFIFAEKIEDVLNAAIPQLGEHFAPRRASMGDKLGLTEGAQSSRRFENSQNVEVPPLAGWWRQWDSVKNRFYKCLSLWVKQSVQLSLWIGKILTYRIPLHVTP